MPDNIEKDAKRAGAETAKRKSVARTPKYAGKKGVLGYISQSQAQDLAAIALARGLSLVDCASKLFADYVTDNPKLAEEGKALQAAGTRTPYRTKRMILEEENLRLREQQNNPTPR